MAFLAFLFSKRFTPKIKEISTPKQQKPALLHLNADLVGKSGYLSGYLSRIYLFSCILDKEQTHIRSFFIIISNAYNFFHFFLAYIKRALYICNNKRG